MPIEMYVDDNGHYQDAEHRAGPKTFETVAAAVSDARRIVDDFLDEARLPGMTAAELFAQYQAFGPDPWLVPGGNGPLVQFSAWDYARERCETIFGSKDGEAT